MMPSEKNTKRVILALDQAYEKFTQLEDESTDEAEIVAYRCYYTNIYESKLYVEQMQKEIDRLKAEQPKWISVSERLPKSMANKVLVFLQHEDYVGYIGYGHYEKYKGTEVWYDLEHNSPFSDRGYTVTHWMELPEEPKDGEQET